jgi:hypothetical protein
LFTAALSLGWCSVRATSFADWAAAQGFTGDDALPTANPTGDGYINALKYIFGTDPHLSDAQQNVGPFLQLNADGTGYFVYRFSDDAKGEVEPQAMQSSDLVHWTPIQGDVDTVPANGYTWVFVHLDKPTQKRMYYQLEVDIPVVDARTQKKAKLVVKVKVGTDVSGRWNGLGTLSAVYIVQEPPPVPGTDKPNTTMYPSVVGTELNAASPELLAQLASRNQRLNLRSWLGWFLWGNGTPPPGLSPGWPVTGSFSGNWDFFSFQYPAGAKNPSAVGSWKPIRLDQQPLYLNPFRVNYAWPPGMFGYQQQPLLPFANQTFYWAQKKIVRGPNLSFANPFFVQYANRVNVPNYPDAWRESWFYMRTRVLETLILVPSNLPPGTLITSGNWNLVTNGNVTNHQLFPYPVWNVDLKPADQTPFDIMVDRIGDFDSDLVWEGTHPGAADYTLSHYRRTAFKSPGQGNYLKMTVAQGSPFVWCETNNNLYMIFYNLIRTNLKGQIDNNKGTDAAMVPGGPWPVPNVQGVSYVLFYGDQINPNQFYHEQAPLYWNGTTETAGGYNPSGKQHNFTYTALFYRTDTAEPVALGANTSSNDGTDALGNPYFYLKFKNPGKNWFVVGSVPVMHYYNTLVPVDDSATRVAAARTWAESMGQYAFNFLTGTSITYSASNMFKVTSTYSTTVQNPFVAIGAPNAAAMTLTGNQTVLALMPHHYQPITLGPDLSQASHPEIVWNPLTQYDGDFPMPANAPPHANKNNSGDNVQRWGYWGPRGNQKAIITGNFTLTYPFQNFLPMMPPPNWSANYTQSGIQAVRVTDVGTGYKVITAIPTATIKAIKGSGADFQVLLETNTGRVQQVNVISAGSGYPDGEPPDGENASLTISPPPIPESKGGRQATARLQIGGGKVLAVFMNDKGAGYQSTIQATQNGVNFDAPIIVPPYAKPAAGGDLQPGLASIITGGAGFNFSGNNSPTLSLIGTGEGAKVELVKVGQLIDIGDSGIGGFTSAGLYPSSGNLTKDAANVVVHVPPPANGQAAQKASVTAAQLVANPSAWAGTQMLNPGKYTSAPAANFTDDDGKVIQCGVDFDGGAGQVTNVFPKVEFKIKVPTAVKFSGGGESTPAKAEIFSGFNLSPSVTVGSPAVGGYQGDLQVSFTGGLIAAPNVTMPQFGYTIMANGTIDPASLKILNPGGNLTRGGEVIIRGGKGFDAAASPVLDSNGTMIAVKVLRQGNNYPATVYTRIDDGGKKEGSAKANLTVNVVGGKIVGITVNDGGNGYDAPVIFFTSQIGGDQINQPAKGANVWLQYGVAIGQNKVTTLTIARPGGGYLPGTEGNDTVDSPGTFLDFSPTRGAYVAPSGQASGYIAHVVKPNINVEQVMYDNIIAQYTSLASNSLRPFGGGFGGNSAPDGYGLGNGLSAAAKFVNLIYEYQQYLSGQGLDQPALPPSLFAFNAGKTPASAYELPIYQRHNPMVTMTGALETSVQAMQRTLSLLFQDPPYSNSPPLDSDQSWQMQYFNQYDPGAGRVVINPSATVPVLGVVSSVANPPAISAEQNKNKTGLLAWTPGKQWSGFGVSDQWNDQHYFYGYYLSTAALAAILDGSWTANITGKPANLWAEGGQMGTAIDQWMLTLANDPNNAELTKSLYTNSNFTYQKFAYFDQWNGHGWATGVSPGRAGDVEQGGDDIDYKPFLPWSVWLSYGTGNGPYDDENENSIWEGIQPWSAIILWGAGTDRPAVVNLGMYLYATENAAGDAYFQDKNYNLPNTSANLYTWVPVTTVDSGTVGNNGGNNKTPANTGYVETTPPAFYTAPDAFGGAASAGNSIIHKGSPSLNNFFYAFPTGSKFIESFPPTAWTLGIARNSDYMRRWAGAMMRPEWTEARNSALYQPANWLSMAMASALSGVPYNPGDVPYGMTGNTLLPTAPAPYVNRLWSSWVTLNAAAGQDAALQPAFKPLDVMAFLHSFDTYGYPDWTYIAESPDVVFTAAFSKQISSTQVVTTFVAFNPGWTTRSTTFYRLGQGNAVGPSVASVTIPPKKLVMQQQTFTN